MPLPLHLELTGQKQGKIDGFCSMEGREKSILIQAIHHRITIPHNAIDGMPSGKKRHAPFSIVKEIDKSSPKLYQALVTGEQFSNITLKYYRLSSLGFEEHYFTQIFENAIITGIVCETPIVFLSKNEPFKDMEIVSFNYQNIKWVYEPDGIETEDKKCAATTPLEDVLNGLEFAFKSTWEVTKFTSSIVAHDVQMALLNYTPLNAGLSFFVGRGINLKEINNNFSHIEEDIKKLSDKIEAIRKHTFSN